MGLPKDKNSTETEESEEIRRMKLVGGASFYLFATFIMGIRLRAGSKRGVIGSIDLLVMVYSYYNFHKKLEEIVEEYKDKETENY